MMGHDDVVGMVVAGGAIDAIGAGGFDVCWGEGGVYIVVS